MPEDLFDERKSLYKDLFFSKLLGSVSYGSLDILLRDARDLDIPCDWPYHRIIVVELETWGELLSRTAARFDPEDRAEANFILNNIAMDLFAMGGRCHVTTTSYQGRLVFWLDAKETGCTDEMFQAAAEKTAKLTEEEFSMVATFAIGKWFQDLFTAFYEYQSVLNLLFYFRYLSDQNAVYTMRHLPETAEPMTFSRYNAWNRSILEAVRTGQLERIKELLQASFASRFLENTVTLAVFPQRRAAFCEFLESTIVELLQQYPMRSLDQDALVLKVSSAETAQEQLATMEWLLDEISNRLQPEAQDPPPWVAELADYVQRSYTDPNMTVYLLAERAGLTPSYCTRIFRRYMGVSLLEYIQRTRVRTAVQLLEAGYTMAQTAAKSGFSCTQTLRRTLKQYRGS